jgi:hypothetical protein
MENLRISNAQHLDSGLVQLHENTVVDLTKAKQLQHFARTRMNLVDTTDADHKGKFRFTGHIVVTGLLRFTLQRQFHLLLLAVFDQVLLGTLEDLDFLLLGFLKMNKSG